MAKVHEIGLIQRGGGNSKGLFTSDKRVAANTASSGNAWKGIH